MITLEKEKLLVPQNHSSKGNQFKWMENGIWYKADYLGYESLSEIIVSTLLKKSNVSEYVTYDFEEISCDNQIYRGCRSTSFLKEGEEIWTCERIYHQFFGESLATSMVGKEVEEKIAFFTESIEQITGIRNFGKYLTMLLEIDTLFLNEDRHTHNIAVIRNERGDFRLCPVFDNGAALFSDTINDYSLDKSLEECYRNIEAKPFDIDFDVQMDAAEVMYGQQLWVDFGQSDIEECIERYKPYYGDIVCSRVKEILRMQKRKYNYLFRK